RDHIAIRLEAADHEEMAVGLAEEEPRQLAVDRRDEWNARAQKTLRLVQRAQPRDEAVETEAARVRDVRGPVPSALVIPVVRVACREVHLRIVVPLAREGLQLIRARPGTMEGH